MERRNKEEGEVELHKCIDENDAFPRGGYGAAVTICLEFENGDLWVDNGEYGNRVNFCPFCGYEAQNKIPWPADNER